MFRHLTAFVLTFCIGLPMCWCCADDSRPAEPTGCCAMIDHCAGDQKAPVPDDKNCPCAKHEDMRDVTATSLKAPAPGLKPLAQPVWLESVIEQIFISPSGKIGFRHDHGPPQSSVPAYTRHCALLL